MSVESVIARIAELDQALVRRSPDAAPATTFASTLGAVQQSTLPAGPAPAPPRPPPPGAAQGAPLPAGGAGRAVPVGWSGAGGRGGQRALQLAQAEVGQAEQPPGSNDSARIAQYRQSTAGSGVGP